MKSIAFSGILTAQADLLSAAGAEEWSAAFRQFADLFIQRPDATVTAVLKAMSPIGAGEGGADGLPVDTIVAAAPAFVQLGASMSKAAGTDAAAFMEWLGKHTGRTAPSVAADALDRLNRPTRTKSKKPVDQEAIASYLRRLETALGDADGFRELYSELARDRAVGLAEAKAIARAFAGTPGKSKKDALETILRRHTQLLGVQAHLKANAGRSAA